MWFKTVAPDTFVELENSISNECNTRPNDTETLRNECSHRFTLVVGMVISLTTLGSDGIVNEVHLGRLNPLSPVPIMQ